MAASLNNKTLVKVFRLLGSDIDGEILAAAAQLRKLCAREGVSLTDLVVTIGSVETSDKKFAKVDVEKAIDVAYRRGLEEGRSEAPGSEATEYFDVYNEPDWHAIARYCSDRIEQLDAWSQGFIKTNLTRTIDGFTTSKTRKILLRTFIKLGGACPDEVRRQYFKPRII